MPMKFKKSHREYKRGVPAAKQDETLFHAQHTKAELFDYINSSNAKPKVVRSV